MKQAIESVELLCHKAICLLTPIDIPCAGLWCVPHPMYWSYSVFLTPCMVCSSPHVWCVPHPMYWSMVCSSPHVLVYGVFLTPCTGLWCVPHPMYWSMVCSSPHVLVYGVFLAPCTGLWSISLHSPSGR